MQTTMNTTTATATATTTKAKTKTMTMAKKNRKVRAKSQLSWRDILSIKVLFGQKKEWTMSYKNNTMHRKYVCVCVCAFVCVPIKQPILILVYCVTGILSLDRMKMSAFCSSSCYLCVWYPQWTMLLKTNTKVQTQTHTSSEHSVWHGHGQKFTRMGSSKLSGHKFKLTCLGLAISHRKWWNYTWI